MYHFGNTTLRNLGLAPLISSILLTSTYAYSQSTEATAPQPAQEQSMDIQAIQVEAEAPAVVITPLTPEQKFAAALEGIFTQDSEESEELVEFYNFSNFAPIWAVEDTAVRNKNLLQLITAVEQAPDHGLPLAKYNIAEVERLWLLSDSIENRAALEAAATKLYVEYARDISSGVLNPRSINKEMNAVKQIPTISELLTSVSMTDDRQTMYSNLGPRSDEYLRMLELKKEMEALLSGGGWGEQVPSGRTLRPGQEAERVAILRDRLNRRGYDVTNMGSNVYDEELAEVVKTFQADFGLNADGLVGPQTLAAINAEPDGRLRQVLVNLERIRWMNHDLGDRHIYVNIPDFMASVVDNGEPTHTFRVVVGKRKHQTAEFSDMMTHMVVNPTWHVPSSIASKEYYPQLLADPTTLARQNIRMLYRGTGEVIDSTRVDYTQYSSGNFPFVLQQRPGRGNALGRVKFMFPNKYNIYLHDTPSKSLFSRDARAYSHGCIRVQNPFDLAYKLLDPQEVDAQTAFHSVLDTGRETKIELNTPIPVHIVYRTAWVDNLGEVQFRHDVYGRDDLVFNALIDAGVTLRDIDG